MMEKTRVFIDNGYLAKISKHLGNGAYLPLDLNQFAITLAKSQNLWCDQVYLYTAPPFQSPNPTPTEAQLRAGYDKFVSKLSRIPNFHIRAGRCQKVDGGYHQKGVDTHLVMDLMELRNIPPGQRDVNEIILVACDTDFVPIIEKVRGAGIKVTIFYYSDFKRKSRFSMSNHIRNVADKAILLTGDHFAQSKPSSNPK